MHLRFKVAVDHCVHGIPSRLIHSVKVMFSALHVSVSIVLFYTDLVN